MTSLAQQLQRLAVPEARAAVAAQRKDRKSLLFDPAEAGGLDKDTFYAIGVNGLQELQGIDPRFQDFESLLFDEASKSLERSIETRDINDRLDKKIRRFLLNVSPYFLLKPAQKAIEWLVYRFHIHEYNVDDLMMCVLPYHETKIFVRAVQLLDLKNKKTKWNWLAPIQKPGVSLSRLSLVTHCISDRGFLHFVCELPILAIKAQKKTALPGESAQLPSNAPLRVLFSFYAATLVSTISSPGAVKESFLASILPFLLRGLKLKYLDYNGATYMIICQLGVSSTLKVTLLEPLTEAMCEHVNPDMIQQMLGCLAVLCRTQNLKQLPGKVMFQICAMPKFLTSLIQLSKSHNITPLLSALLPHLTTTAINAEVSEENQLPEGCKELDLIASLTGVLRETHIESPIVVATARCLLHGYVSACSSGLEEDPRTELREKIAPVVQSLERRFPEAMDLILESYLAEIEDHDKQKYIQDFISMYSGGMKHQLLPEANTSLVLSLNHANPDVRRMAVNHIQNLIQKGGDVDSFFQESLLQRLQDDSMAVVGAVLQIDEYLCELLPVDSVFAALQKLLTKKKKKHGNDWNNVVRGAIKVITSQTFVSKAPHLVDDAVAMTIPHIFTSTQANSALELEIRAEIAGSQLVHSHPLMKGLKAVLTSKRATSESKMTSKVLDLLGKNMAALKQEQVVKMVSSLISHLGASSKPEAYRLIVTTVILRALQHAHGAESKLYMARKLLAVLEVDALKTCQRNTELIRTELGEDAEEQDCSFQPVGVPSAELPPHLHTHLAALLSLRRKHRVAGTVYLHSSQVQAMVWALESMVLSLTPSVSALAPDSKWWVPGTEEGHVGGQFVTFLLQLVDLLTQGSTECHLKDKTKQGFRNIMHSVNKNLFADSTSFLKLLSIGWIGHVMPSQPMGFKPSPLFQVRCLNMASALFGSVEQDELCTLLAKESSVIPCLLMSLSSPLEPVRTVAIRCLQTINNSYHGGSASPYYWLIQRLLKKKEAIELDSGYIKHALGNSLMKASKVPVISFPKQRKAEASPDVKGASAVQAKQCLERILEYVKQEGIPHQAQRALLHLLEEVDSDIVLSSLMDLLQDLLVQAFVSESALSVEQTHSLHCILSHMTPQTAHLMSEQKCLDLFLEVLSREKPVCAGLASPLEMALKQMTGAFFTALPTAAIQQTVLARLIDLQVDTNSSATANHLAKVIKKLPLQASQVVKELSQITVGQKPKSVKDARRVRQKQKAADDTTAKSSTSEGRAWQRVMMILENLQQRKIGKMEDRHTIVPTLFTLLSLCLELPATDQGSSEYIKQLLLTTILNICDHLGEVDGEDAGPLITEEQFSVELVVQCIRTSDNPQTHNHALLLLATAAKLFPEHVLHNIMAIFTFMGASLLRQDDSHSFQIIHKTVQTVIPALVKASKDQSLPSSLAGNLEDVVTMVMQTFVDAFPHIPEHRRLPLFTHLVQSVGGAEYLWRVVLLLIGGYATKGATAMLPEETETKGPGRNLEFWLTLCHHFDPETQVISLTKMLGYLATLKAKKEGAKSLSHSTRSTRSTGVTPGSKDLIFDQDTHSARHLRHFKFTSVGFLSQLLISDPFIAQLVNHSEERSAAMQALYQKLLEQTLCYITHVAHCIQDNTDPNTAKFWRALLHKAYDVLDKVNYLLPAKVFIGVVSGLLGNRLPTVRRKAMELLNNKLIQNKEGFTEEETTMLLSMLDTLVTIAKSSRENTTESDELDINRQTALYSLKLLCKLFGSEHRKEFTKVMEVALHVVMETQSSNQVIASGLLCLAEAVSSLKAHAIPYLSRFMPPLLDTLSSKPHATSSDLHLLSTVTAIQKILETLPHFLSPYLGQLLQQVCRLSGDRQDEEKSQLTLRLKACRHQLSTALPPRVLIPAVSECYKTSVSTSQMSIGPLMSILSDHLDQLPKEDLLSHHHAMVSLFLQALDYRSTHAQSRLEEVSTIEGHVINAVNTMVMKLSEATFRPMFLKVYEWATRGNNPDRLLTFYRLSDGIAEKLKSLFCLFAGHLVANIAGILDANNVIKTDKPFFEDAHNKEKSASLLGYALDCLHKCFHYDKGDFVSKERFEKLMQPLVDQIENTQGGDDIYQERISSHLTPCIVQFMVAARDPSTWQPLNYQILLKTRNSFPKVRYAALSVLQSVHSQLGEDYLSLLPETIPFLAELMEDESVEVEQRCQDVVSELEKTLGEPLQKYF